MRKDFVTVRVPASTSNLGSGFDTLGLALNLYCTLSLQRAKSSGIRFSAPIPESSRASASLMIEETMRLFFQATGSPAFGIEIGISSEIPMARGLGASAALRVGLLAGLDRLAKTRLTKADLLQMATTLEHHPDNASPAIFGGFTVSGAIEGKVRCLRFPVSPALRMVTLIPDFQIATEQARTLLPETYAKGDAAHALNRCGLITAAFASQDYQLLRGVFDDRMHQPYRAPLIPRMSAVIAAGVECGALGGFLSGSGSALICLATRNVTQIAEALTRTHGSGTVRVLKPDNKGLVIR